MRVERRAIAYALHCSLDEWEETPIGGGGKGRYLEEGDEEGRGC